MNIQDETMRQMKEMFQYPTVLLYDQFGGPIYVPSSKEKIGQAIQFEAAP